MPSRRDILRLAGLAAVSPQAAWAQIQDKAKKPKPAAGTILVNDVHAQLSSARVFKIEQPVNLEGVRKAFALAKEEERPVCIAGGRHSMGGQPFVADGVMIDVRKLNKVLAFNDAAGLIEVESGVMWPQLLEYLVQAQRGRNPQWTFSQKQAGADRMTLGGSLSANIHGRGLTLPPFIGDIEAFTLLDHRGQIVQCSRSENQELFQLAIGGFGLFGFVYSVTLRLVPRRKLERVVEVRDIAGLMEAVGERVKEGYVYGDFHCSVDDRSEEFLRRGVFTCYRPVPDDTAMSERQSALSERDIIEQLFLAHTDKAEAFKRYATHYFATTGQLHWSDEQQMSIYPDAYHRELDRRWSAPQRGSETITEILCERPALEQFMAAVREASRREKFEIIQASVRVIERDTESFLTWARRPSACVTLHVHVEHNSSGTIRAGDALRRLIDLGLKHGGGWYPAYHRYALPRQVDFCFPQMREFLKLKLKYDPQETIQSDWYRHYKRMYFG